MKGYWSRPLKKLNSVLLVHTASLILYLTSETLFTSCHNCTIYKLTPSHMFVNDEAFLFKSCTKTFYFWNQSSCSCRTDMGRWYQKDTNIYQAVVVIRRQRLCVWQNIVIPYLQNSGMSKCGHLYLTIVFNNQFCCADHNHFHFRITMCQNNYFQCARRDR